MMSLPLIFAIMLGYDARQIINAQQEARVLQEGYRAPCDADRFLAFRREFSLYTYPEGFKPVGLHKYDGKTAPHQWLRICFQAIDVAGGTDTTKVAYFLLAPESAKLLWLDSLSENIMDSWETLRRQLPRSINSHRYSSRFVSE